MSGVLQNIDPPPGRVCMYPPPPHPPWCGGKTHSLGGEGGGANILEDARNSSVLYIWKCFVDIEPVLLNVYGAPELMPRNEFRQPM
jgi:hypothetical protein